MKVAIGPSPQVSFPRKQVIAELSQWWDDEILSRSDNPLTQHAQPNTLFDLIPHMDSLCFINALLALEPILHFDIPHHVIRKGGYSSKQDMLNHILPRIEKEYAQRQKQKTRS